MSNTKLQIQQLLARRELARRRLLQFTKLTFPQYEAGWVHDDVSARLEKFSRDVSERKSPRLMLLLPPRHGKLLADDTEILTSQGWRTHGSLQVGDQVLGLNGTWINVIGTSRPGLANLCVVTNAGTRITAHEHHEWAVDEYKQNPGISKWTDKTDKPARAYVRNRVETREILERKNTKGLRAQPKTMRYYYLPTPNFDAFPIEARSLFEHMRLPKNGGRLAIEDVYEVDPVPGKCIQVDSPDGIYLVTRDFVPTHNSELASIRFPAWHLGHNPSHEIINVGYNLDLPMKFSRKVREILRDPHYTAMFPESVLDKDSQSVEAWNTTRGGGFTAAGVGGGITGKGAHVLTIDDPLKNQEEADSADRRQLLEEWYESTAYTRLAPGGGVLLIETWWNDDDLAGRLQTKMRLDPLADQFEVVKYPALSEKFEYRDPETGLIIRSETEIKKGDINSLGLSANLELLREPDQCLHEARYPVDALKRIRANVQPRVWSALYQQNPVPDEGMYFRKEYFRHHITLPEPYGLRLFTAWDFAIGEKQTNDWTVGVTLLQDRNDVLYVFNVRRFRGDSYQIVENMLDEARNFLVHFPTADYILGVEDGQIWKAIKPLFERRQAERRLFPSLQTLKPLTDKLARARPLQGRMQQGRVVFPQEAEWLNVTQQELLRFPAGVNDDIVDAMAWAVHLCLAQAPLNAPEPEKTLPSWRDKLSEHFEDSTSGASHMAA